MSNIKDGNIIYWNPTLGYGFVECKELSNSIFFHKSNCAYENIQLFDNVSFQTFISNSKKHKGKPIAIDINLNERGNFKNYDLRIGTIQNWNGKFGFIDYPTDGKKIFLFHTRLLYSKIIQNGDIIVFNPIVSTKDTTQLFAFFAYPITFESDIEFIKKQYTNYQIPALKDYILFISKVEDSHDKKFELELIEIGFISTGEDYLKLIEVIKRYKEDFNFIPEYDLLSKYVSEVYLIQLWESNIIDSYSLHLIKEYFIRANADIKRFIIQKVVSIEDRENILDYYFSVLQESNKFTQTNNDIKTFLDIVYRNPKTRFESLYDSVKSILISTLPPDELIDLWLHDYIDDLSENFIISNFNIGDFNSVSLLLQKKDKEGKYKELFSKIYEQYFINFANGILDFELEYPKLIKYLTIFESEFEERYSEIINIIRVTFTDYQKFVLWVLGINIKFDAIYFIRQNVGEINHYFRLKFILRCYKEMKNFDIEEYVDLTQITLNGLKDFAGKYKWNDVIYPTEILGAKVDFHRFLLDIKNYNSICNKDINVHDLADTIYNSVEKYNEIHIRLWLYDYVSHYDYVGFRESYKNLTNEERKKFRDKANEKEYFEVIEKEISEVKPCKNFIQNEDGTKTYNAFMENIYFGTGSIMLRMEDEHYTKPSFCKNSSTWLNRIPESHWLNKFPITITVWDSEIIEIIGLEEIEIKIHTGEIEKALGIEINPKNSGTEDFSYAEDWKLRKQILDFLDKNQDESINSTIVNEPTNFRRHLDENSVDNDFEKTELYTINLHTEYAIIWENIDFSEDRATYIFKCSLENHRIQIQKIANAIVSLAQLRSTLSSVKEENELQIFKNNFGFVASIRKQRGKNESFENWLEKLEKALRQPVPELPTKEELERLKNWNPEVPHTARIRKPHQKKYKESAIIKEADLAKTDIFEEEKQSENDKQTENTINPKYDKQNSLLNSLIAFNQYFTENLNIDI